MTVAALREVEVDYPRGRALGPFSLEIGAGEIVALVGPSGCGKSTAMRLLAGLEAPSRGEVIRTPGRGETAVVFQAPTLAPWRTARGGFAALPLELAGVGKAEAAARADAALARVGLAQPRPRGRRSFPAAWPCGCRWPGRWSPGRSCCCWTSPSRPWMRSPAAPSPTTSCAYGTRPGPASFS